MYIDPREKNEYHAWFLVRDFESHPKEITDQLGIEPTDIKVKGEYKLIGKKNPQKIINRENLWILDSELSKKSSLEDHLKQLLNKVKPYRQNFIELAQKYKLELNCAVYYYEANPGIFLESDIIKEVSELNASLNLDIYCLGGAANQLEDPKLVKALAEQLAKVKFISQLSDKEHNEAAILTDSLKRLEEACASIHGLFIPDLFWEPQLPDEDYEARLEKIGKEIQSILSSIEESKYLRKYLNHYNTFKQI